MALKVYPTGTIMPFPNAQADSIPDGWMLCDGSEINRGTYGNLYSLLGDTYGSGDGANTFNIPDLQEWFIKGVDSTSMSTDAGTEVSSSVHFQNASYTYNLNAQVANSQYQDSVSTINQTLSSAGNHRHLYEVITDGRNFGCGFNDVNCKDHMLPTNPIASDGITVQDLSNNDTPVSNDTIQNNGSVGRIHHRYGNVQIPHVFGYHSQDSATQNQQYSHAKRSRYFTYYCPQLVAALPASSPRLWTGTPSQGNPDTDVWIGEINNGFGKYLGTDEYAWHTHYICAEFQIEGGKTVLIEGDDAREDQYVSNRMFTTRQKHNHTSISLIEQSGITHGSTEHQFTGTVTADWGIPAENVGTETLPSAIVMAYIIKT